MHEMFKYIERQSAARAAALHRIKSEAIEARGCLDRENPNIPMALRRINDILAAIEKAWKVE